MTLADRPGAVPGLGVDAGVAAHYGDPLREQRLLAEQVGWVDRSHRGVVAVPGADRLGWLHSLTSQHLSGLADGHGTEALLLSPHGHVEHHLLVADLAGTTWLDVEPGTAADLAAYLDRMRFLLRVEPADRSTTWAVLSLVGPRVPEVLAGLGVEAPAAYDVVPWRDGWVRRMPHPGADAADLLVPRAELASAVELLGAAGAAPAGHLAYEALRIAGRRPRLGVDTDHRTIPNETPWLRSAVHLDKGCYRGQETVARVDNLGRPPRRLALLHLDGSAEELPPPGSPIVVAGRAVGTLGSSAWHHELGPIALALLKRSVSDDAALLVGEPGQEQVAAVDPDPDATPDAPRRPRPAVASLRR